MYHEMETRVCQPAADKPIWAPLSIVQMTTCGQGATQVWILDLITLGISFRFFEQTEDPR